MPARLLRSVVLLTGFALSLAWSQQFPLQLTATSGNQVLVLANGQALPFVAAVGQPLTVQVTATYAGSGKITVPATPTVLGSTEFTSVLSAAPPISLTPGQSFSFTITFKPTSSQLATAIFNLPFTESVTAAGSTTPTVTSNAINLSLQGSAASYVLSYVKDNNVVPLAAGGTMLFDPQPINTTVQLALNISNNGSAEGEVTDLTISGKAFQFSGKPQLPIGIPAAQVLQVGIQYLPTTVETDTGQVQITFIDGTMLTVVLQGSGTAPKLVYTVTQNGKSTTATPNGTIAFPNTNVGSTATALVRVQNTGNASITIGSVSVDGQSFSITVPPVLPKTLNTNDSITFTIAFAPTTPGAQTGQLLVGSDLFTLTGTGLGSLLQFSYVAAGSKLTIGQNGVTAVVFSPVQVTQTASIPFTVTNTGTLPTVISNIGIAGNNSPFSISGAPSLPKNLAAGASFTFNVTFTPTTVASLNDTLLINTTTVPLSGQGTAPPALPAYTISGPSGTVAPQTQPSVSLKLASPYPVAIDGVLTLTTSSTLVPDPTVQFSTQGRTVAFTIPANGTTANFAGQGSQIQLQTGTVASTITLTPSFTTATGGVPLTPTNPTTLQLTVPSEAPVLIAGTVASTSTSSFTLNVTGFTTTRSLTSLNVQFTAAAGFTLASPTVTVDLTSAATVWFDSASSQGFGGNFTVSVPFNFSGTVPANTSLLQSITSVSATISNTVGASNGVSTTIP
jgi:hypothetical protein